MSREGFVFVRIEGQEEDVYVKASKTRGALHGDTVRVAVTQEKVGSAKRRSGEIIAVLERSNKPFVGILHIVGKQAWVLMSSKTMPYDISVPVPEGAERGMKVAAVVDGWERGGVISAMDAIKVCLSPRFPAAKLASYTFLKSLLLKIISTSCPTVICWASVSFKAVEKYSFLKSPTRARDIPPCT